MTVNARHLARSALAVDKDKKRIGVFSSRQFLWQQQQSIGQRSHIKGRNLMFVNAFSSSGSIFGADPDPIRDIAMIRAHRFLSTISIPLRSFRLISYFTAFG